MPLKRCQMCLSGEPEREVRVTEPRKMGSRNQPIDTGSEGRVPGQGRGGFSPRPSHQFLEAGLGWRPQLS